MFAQYRVHTYHLPGDVCVILQSEVSPSQSYADWRKAKQRTSHSLPLNREEFPWQHTDISTCVSNGGPSLDLQYVNISKGSNLGHLPRQIGFSSTPTISLENQLAHWLKGEQLLLCGFLCLANDKTPSIALSFTVKYWMTKLCTSGLKLLEHK